MPTLLKLIILLVITTSFFSCTHDRNLSEKENKEINLKHVTLQTDQEYKLSKLLAVDDLAYTLYLQNIKPEIFISIGYHCDMLTEPEHFFSYNDSLAKNLKTPKDSLVYDHFITYKSPRDKDYYRYQNIFFDTIDSRPCKLIKCIRTGKGITGAYFDSIAFDETMGNLRMNIYTLGLNKNEEKVFDKLIKTIKFKIRYKKRGIIKL
jgi:hypothetical protein